MLDLLLKAQGAISDLRAENAALRDQIEHPAAVMLEMRGEVERLTAAHNLLKADFEANADETIALRKNREELWQENQRLTALCDGYRGEVKTLTNTIDYLKQEDGREIKRLADTLTRARAEGMEEAAQIAECTELPNSMHAELMMRNKIATSIRARAAKGDSDEG